MWWDHSPILCSIFIGLAVTSWQLVVRIESLAEEIIVLQMISGTNSVWLCEHVVPVVYLNWLSIMHWWHNGLASTSWTDYLITELCKWYWLELIRRRTYLVWMKIDLLLVFHLLIKSYLHLSLLHHLKLSLNLLSSHTIYIDGCVLSEVWPAYWLLWKRLMAVRTTFNWGFPAVLSHCALLRLKLWDKALWCFCWMSCFKAW